MSLTSTVTPPGKIKVGEMAESLRAVEVMQSERVNACSLIEAIATMFRPDFFWTRFEAESNRVWQAFFECRVMRQAGVRTVVPLKKERSPEVQAELIPGRQSNSFL